jgi:hypothetical protein
MKKSLVELFAMLKVAEKDIQKNTNNVCWWGMVLSLRKKRSGSKKKGSSKGAVSSHTPRKESPEPKADAKCFFYKKGH